MSGDAANPCCPRCDNDEHDYEDIEPGNSLTFTCRSCDHRYVIAAYVAFEVWSMDEDGEQPMEGGVSDGQQEA